MTLFDDVAENPPGRPSPELVARVVPDVPAMNRELDYAVPAEMADRLQVGSVVRVPLHGRSVRGWVVGLSRSSSTTRDLTALSRISGIGPDEDVIEVCRWAAWRWAGRLPTLLRVGTPDRIVSAPARRPPRAARPEGADPQAAALLEAGGVQVLVVSPRADPLPVAAAAAARGQALFVAPTIAQMERVSRGLARLGVDVARWPLGFAAAAAGHTVVGGRGAAFAPLPSLGAVVVWDEHDEGLQNESSPTWHARDLAVHRARRAGVSCLLVSPCPSPDALALADGDPVEVPADRRRQGWAPLVVVDRRDDDRGRTGLYSEQFVKAATEARAGGGRVLCVLNRTGRARLLACRSCGATAECERCGSAVHQPEEGGLLCGRCGAERPVVCLVCGGTSMALLRAGVTRAREELAALLREPVGQVGARRAAGMAGPSASLGPEGVLIGTEAILHQAGDASLVAFLDMDQELLAPRYRAAEEAMALLVLASRAVGGRAGGGRVLVQTRLPEHPVLTAAVRADSLAVTEAEIHRRSLLGMPPSGTVAAVGGEAAPEFVERLGSPMGVVVQGPRDGWWLVRAGDAATLSDELAAVSRPPGRLRLRVDPVRLP